MGGPHRWVVRQLVVIPTSVQFHLVGRNCLQEYFSTTRILNQSALNSCRDILDHQRGKVALTVNIPRSVTWFLVCMKVFSSSFKVTSRKLTAFRLVKIVMLRPYSLNFMTIICLIFSCCLEVTLVTQHIIPVDDQGQVLDGGQLDNNFGNGF
jgi:hypothetical protein